MKSRLLIGFLFLLMLVYSCEPDNNVPDTENPFSAEVLGLNGDCGIYAIKITEREDEVIGITGLPSMNSLYIAQNLPDEFKKDGLKIRLNLRKPNDNELGICRQLGPSYPWVFVIAAAKR